MSVRIAGPRFVDERGRTLILRGVNLGGSSKVPRRPDGATHRRDGFLQHRDVSFVGRPFPLEEADEHLARLRAWGFNFLRLLVTWEGIEHAGPGRYDEEYLDYVRAVAERAGRFGFDLYIDPHQDMWSRFSGGDGAPGWTLEAVGLDPSRLAATGAAVVHQLHEGPLPPMIWPSNETRLACATLFSLFFGGNDFAPATRIDGEPAQEFLQRHYVAAICRLAERLRDLPHVVGYDTMNEPSRGYLGWQDLSVPGGLVQVGPRPSPFEAMRLGAGETLDVDVWEARPTGFKRIGRRAVNQGGARAWLPGHDCVWRQNGVWDSDGGEARLLRPDHFALHSGRPLDFSQDHYLPFARRFRDAIHAVHPDALIFVESAPQHPPPRWDAPGIVYAPHWYDGFALFFRRYSDWVAVDSRRRGLVFTPWWIQRSFAAQLEALRRESHDRLNDAPTLIGEFGIPFDMQGGRAFHDGDFRMQEKAMDRTCCAFEATLLSGALWNYTPDNSNARGDQWNGEDLSIFSRDQQSDPSDLHSGGRALAAFVRPYARAIAGEPLRMRFDWHRRMFELVFRHAPDIAAPTEIFLPALQYPDGVEVRVSDGSFQLMPESQRLEYRHGTEREVHTVHVRPVSTKRSTSLANASGSSTKGR